MGQVLKRRKKKKEFLRVLDTIFSPIDLYFLRKIFFFKNSQLPALNPRESQKYKEIGG